MVGIPPALDTDAEDVAWALQTAEALWKRDERIDAIVWLRRAAQAAGDAEDDDRALALASDAAELADWIARNPPPAAVARSTAPSNAPTAAEAVDDLLRRTQADDTLQDQDAEEADFDEGADLRLPKPPAIYAPALPDEALKPIPRASSSPAATLPLAPSSAPTLETSALDDSPPTREALQASDDADTNPPRPPPPLSPPPPSLRQPHVPSAAETHAGMLDPWSEAEAAPKLRADGPRAAPSHVGVSPNRAAESEGVITSAPPIVKPERASPRPPQSSPVRPPSPIGRVDLSRVDALSDLPDDARVAFARSARVQDLAQDEEIAGFALALVIDGSAHLTATITDVVARTLDAGAMVRARGTTDHIVPLRIVATSPRAQIATWDELSVFEAFRTCPWVEHELRVAGDRFQAEVGATMGALGERFDPVLRAEVIARLSLRTLTEHEVVAARGAALPGLLVVGAGELELVDDQGGREQAPLRPGEFLLPAETLRGAVAPSSIRAAKGGALVLMAERGLAQELLMTFAPLLEIFAAG